MSRPVLAMVAALLTISACKKEGEIESAPTRSDFVTETDLPDQGLTQQAIDLDQDGKPEITNYLKDRADAPRLLVRKEIDLNRDGKVDVISFFDERGELEREEIDSDYDGKFDHVDHYQGGLRVKSEYDTDFDGNSNVQRYYVKGEDGVLRLERKERDENGDGRTDVWERFGDDGKVIITGRDTDGDGKMDVREE